MRSRNSPKAANTATWHADMPNTTGRSLQRAAAETKTRPAAEWLAVYGLDIDNVRAALDWAFAPGGDVTIGVALTVASERAMVRPVIDRRMSQARRTCARQPDSGVPGSARLEMQLHATLAASLFHTKGPGPEASAAWRDVLETAERLDDTEYRLRALWGLWYNHISNGECRAALTLAQRYYRVPRDRLARPTCSLASGCLGRLSITWVI